MIRAATEQDLNHVANVPQIKRHFGVPENTRINLTDYYTREGNVAFMSDLGAMLFAFKKDGEYECHFLFFPGGKGILDVAREMHNEMFTKYDARVIKGYPPRSNRAVRVIGNALGYEKIDHNHIDGLGRTCEIYELRREKWETL